MPELSVVIVAADNEQRAVLQVLVDGTSVARTVIRAPAFRWRFPTRSCGACELPIPTSFWSIFLAIIPPSPCAPLNYCTRSCRIRPCLPLEALSQPQVIVDAMRAGAREFIERPTTTTDLLEAFVRLTAAQRRCSQEETRGQSIYGGQRQGRQRRDHRCRESGAGSAVCPRSHRAGGSCPSRTRRTAFEPEAAVHRGRRNPEPASPGQFPAGKLHDPP